MPKKKSKKGKKGNSRPQKDDHDDFDPLANAVIDDEFAIPVSSKKKKSKPKKEEKQIEKKQDGPLGGLKSKAAAYKIETETFTLLEGEGLEDADLEDLGEDDLKEMGLSEQQAKCVASAVRGDPIEDSSPLKNLRAKADAHGITADAFKKLEDEGLTDEDVADLEQDDLEGMGLSSDQAARVIRAVKGEAPLAAEDVKLPKLREKATEFKVDDKTIATLEAEGLDDEDLYEMDKNDYKGLGIKLGQAVRVIKAVKAMIEATKNGEEEVTAEGDAGKTDAAAEEGKQEPEIPDFDALDFDDKPKKKKKKKNKSKGNQSVPKEQKADDDDDPFAAFAQAKPEGEPKLTKAQLKRRRQKEAAEKAKREAAERGDTEVTDKAEPDDGEVDISKMSKKARKKYLKRLKDEEEAKKKAERLQKLLEERKRLEDEEKRKVEEEKRRKEEEKRMAEEEERRKEEERIRKKEEKKRKRLEMKKQGLILTKKQKEERRRLELARKRLEKSGGVPQETNNRPRRDRDRRRRGGNKKVSAKMQAIQEAEAARRKAEELAAAEEAAEAAPAAKEEEAKADDNDDWEADANDDGEDDWEAAADVDSEEEREKERQKEEEAKKAAEEAAKKKAEEEKKKAEAEKKAAEEKLRQEEGKKGKKGKKGRKGRKDKDTRELRSPICCILGHVDTGKTKLLDKMRSTNVQDREAGGITQQIGATYFPMTNIEKATAQLVASTGKALNAKMPGLLMIDTPGHESFTNLRARGSNLCDIAILVVDLMHGLEPQTLESIRLLKERGTPFVVALNKVDRLYEWKSTPNGPVRDSLKQQKKHVQQEFETRTNQVIAEFAKEAELNTVLYYKNKNPKEWTSLVPTSAHTGEGIPDLLWLLVKMTQNFMRDQIAVSYTDLQCTVLEVKKVEGLGTTIDVVLVNGVLHEGDTIVVCGLQGPIVTTIRALLTPPPMKEIRVKSEYVHHKEIKAAMGVKITANGLDHAVAGTQLLVCGKNDDIEELKDESMADLASILTRVDPSGQGVYVQASTLGSLEALLQFLEDMKVPVSGVAIGPVNKKDVMKAAVMLERREEYAVILAFDVTASPEAKQMANEMGVTIFSADIIYHLFDMVTKYFEDVKAKRRAEAAPRAVFPCILRIIPEFIFNKRSPIVVGVEVMEGILRKGTPLCIPDKKPILDIGSVTSIEFEHKERNEAKKGEQVCIKIEQNRGNQVILLGRHFDASQNMVSRLSRESIKLLKENFKSDLQPDDWKLVVKLKKVFEIYGASN